FCVYATHLTPRQAHHPRPPSSAAHLPPLTPVRRRVSRSSWRCLLALTSVFQSRPPSAAPSPCHRTGSPLAVTSRLQRPARIAPASRFPSGHSVGHPVTR